MNALMQIVKEALDNNDFKYDVYEEDEMFSLPFFTENLSLRIKIGVHMERDLIVILAILPVKIPEKRRNKVYKALNDINYENTTACLCMDSTDGEIISKAYINCEEGGVNPTVINVTMALVINNLDNFFDTIFGEAYSDEYRFNFDNDSPRLVGDSKEEDLFDLDDPKEEEDGGEFHEGDAPGGEK